jgi:enamine deaminase RidA (YjgF/YER057c/UK114 family)
MLPLLFDIPGRPSQPHYRQVAVAAGTKHIFLAGQTGTDEDGNIAGERLSDQAYQALVNVIAGLNAAAASPHHLVKLTIYVVDWSPDKFQELGMGLGAAVQEYDIPPVPVTMIGVAALFTPEHLVEIEAQALVP